VSGELGRLVELCGELPPHRGHPFVARWDGTDWEALGHVWGDGHIEIKAKTKLGKYDRMRRGEVKWSLGVPPFEDIAKDDVPTTFI
jgi:hypothetical protein